MNLAEIRNTIINADYTPSSIVDSTGEHLTKYMGGHHAVCLAENFGCNPNRMGALTDNEHAVLGFPSLLMLIAFLNKAFPQHKTAHHPTRFIIPFK